MLLVGEEEMLEAFSFALSTPPMTMRNLWIFFSRR
jgi:hypothetical protein